MASIIFVAMKYLEANGFPTLSRMFKVLEGEKSRGADIRNLRKALMESKDAVEARQGISKMAHDIENAPDGDRETMLRKISEAARLKTQPTPDVEAPSENSPRIIIPGSEQGGKEQKTKKNLIQEIKPEDRPLQKPVHTITVVHKSDQGKTCRELVLKVPLPHAPSASDVELDVGLNDVNLFVPGFYQSEIVLPQSVIKEAAKASFSKRSKTLRLTLPVIQAAA